MAHPFNYDAAAQIADDIATIDRRSAKNYVRYPFDVVAGDAALYGDPAGRRILDLGSCYSAVLSHRWQVAKDAFDREFELGSDAVPGKLYNARYAEFLRELHLFTGYDRALMKADGGSVTGTVIKLLRRH